MCCFLCEGAFQRCFLSTIILALTLGTNHVNAAEKRRQAPSKGTGPAEKNKDSNTPLLDAASDGNLEAVKKLLQEAANINELNSNNDTALIAVTKIGLRDVKDLGVIPVIIGRPMTIVHLGCKISPANISNTQLDTDLNSRIYSIASILIDKQIDINKKNKDNQAALHIAAAIGHTKLVELLASRSADLNIQDGVKHTPLHYAAANGHTDTIKTLLHYGADLTAKSISNLLPIDYACYYDNKEATEYLKMVPPGLINAIDKGDEKRAMELFRGRSPIINELYGRKCLYMAAESGNKKLIKLLTDHGVSEDIFSAILVGANDSIEKLSENKNNLQSKNPIDSLTPVYYAVKKNDVKMVKFLLSKGAKLSVQDEYGITPLHKATSKEMAEFLLNNGLDLSARDNFGNTVMHNAATDGNVELVQFLICRNNKLTEGEAKKDTPLMLAAARNKTEVVDLLLKNGANPSAENEVGKTALFYALYTPGKEEVAKALIQAGAKQTVFSAAALGEIELLRKFIADKADLNERTKASLRTPLEFAIIHNQIVVAKMLLENGASVKLSDIKGMGYQPIHFACEFGRKELVELFLDRGADVNALSASMLSMTPLILAVENEHFDVVATLTRHGANVNGLGGLCVSSPLRSACAKGCVDIALWLKALGGVIYLETN